MQGELLVQIGLIRPEGLISAKQRQRRTGEDLEEAVLALQMLSERDLLRAVARHRGQQYLTTEKVSDLKIPDEVIDRVPVRISEALSVMPFRLNPDGTLWVLAGRELKAEEVEQLRRLSDVRAVSQILARNRTVKAAQRRHYYRDPHAFQELEEADAVARLKPPVPEELPSIDVDLEGDTTREPLTPAVSPPEATEVTATPVAPAISAVPTGATRRVPFAENLREVSRELERLRVALSISSALASVRDIHAVAAEILAAMLDLSGGEGVGFALTGDDGAPLLLESRRRSGSDAGQLAISSSIVSHVVSSQRALLLLDAQVDPRFGKEESLVSRKVRSIVCAPIVARRRIYGALYAESSSQTAFEGADLQTLTMLGEVAGSALEQALAAQKLEDEVAKRTTLRRFFPAELVERSASGKEPFSLAPARVRATLLVARVPDASWLANATEPVEGMRLLDDAVDSMARVVFGNGASLEGPLRTGVSAIFGPPRGEKEHVERAMLAAVELAKLGAKRKASGWEELAIGVSTGEMLVGALGPSSRMQLVALGEAADSAHRLCAMARPGQILATAEVKDAAGRFFSWEEHSEHLESRGELLPLFSLRWK